jgi:hypothetical protein
MMPPAQQAATDAIRTFAIGVAPDVLAGAAV